MHLQRLHCFTATSARFTPSRHTHVLALLNCEIGRNRVRGLSSGMEGGEDSERSGRGYESPRMTVKSNTWAQLLKKGQNQRAAMLSISSNTNTCRRRGGRRARVSPSRLDHRQPPLCAELNRARLLGIEPARSENPAPYHAMIK